MTDIELLNKVIKQTTQKIINENTKIPCIYTAIVDKVNDNGSVTVHFAHSVESKMTFSNMSIFTPVVGQGVYILTLGGDKLTGAFIIATSGLKNNINIETINSNLNDIVTQIQDLNTRVTNLENS